MTDTGVDAPHVLVRAGRASRAGRLVVLDIPGGRGGRDDPHALVYEAATWRRTTTPVHWAVACREPGPLGWLGGLRGRVVDAREIAGNPRIVGTSKG